MKWGGKGAGLSIRGLKQRGRLMYEEISPCVPRGVFSGSGFTECINCTCNFTVQRPQFGVHSKYYLFQKDKKEKKLGGFMVMFV